LVCDCLFRSPSHDSIIVFVSPDALRPQSAQYCNIFSTRSGQIWPSFPHKSHFWSSRA
ncbi:hypothetical protein SERLA73DRAFT_189013, partial [Serpula lacrymans var. lacrymans S7.3]